jgi:hypothetical protein
MTPTAVVESCLRGLSERMRTGVGGTQAAVVFAEMVAERFPIDQMSAADCVEAHRLLDESVLAAGGETTELRISRNLWGGDLARDFCARLLEDEPLATQQVRATNAKESVEVREPELAMAAELTTPEWLQTLSEVSEELNGKLEAQVEALLALAYSLMLKRSNEAARKATNRVPAAIAADLDIEMADIAAARDLVKSTRYGWPEEATPILAMLTVDLQEALEEVAEDLGVSIEEAVRGNHEELNRRLAAELGVSVREVEDELQGEQDAAAREAGVAAVGLLIAWVTSVLRGRGLETEPELSASAVIPADIGAAIVATAGGASGGGGAAVSRSSIGTVLTPDGEPSSGRGVSPWGARFLRKAAEELLGRFGELGGGGQELRIVTEYTWVYGSKSTRFQPFEPHCKLDGDTWIDEEERGNIVRPDADDFDPTDQPTLDGYYPQDHRGCQCRIAERFALEADGVRF